MTQVWVKQVECGDYYCGCGGGHIVGVYVSKEAAEQDPLPDKLDDAGAPELFVPPGITPYEIKGS